MKTGAARTDSTLGAGSAVPAERPRGKTAESALGRNGPAAFAQILGRQVEREAQAHPTKETHANPSATVRDSSLTAKAAPAPATATATTATATTATATTTTATTTATTTIPSAPEALTLFTTAPRATYTVADKPVPELRLDNPHEAGLATRDARDRGARADVTRTTKSQAVRQESQAIRTESQTKTESRAIKTESRTKTESQTIKPASSPKAESQAIKPESRTVVKEPPMTATDPQAIKTDTQTIDRRRDGEASRRERETALGDGHADLSGNHAKSRQADLREASSGVNERPGEQAQRATLVFRTPHPTFIAPAPKKAATATADGTVALETPAAAPAKAATPLVAVDTAPPSAQLTSPPAVANPQPSRATAQTAGLAVQHRSPESPQGEPSLPPSPLESPSAQQPIRHTRDAAAEARPSDASAVAAPARPVRLSAQPSKTISAEVAPLAAKPAHAPEASEVASDDNARPVKVFAAQEPKQAPQPAPAHRSAGQPPVAKAPPAQSQPANPNPVVATEQEPPTRTTHEPATPSFSLAAGKSSRLASKPDSSVVAKPNEKPGMAPAAFEAAATPQGQAATDPPLRALHSKLPLVAAGDSANEAAPHTEHEHLAEALVPAGRAPISVEAPAGPHPDKTATPSSAVSAGKTDKKSDLPAKATISAVHARPEAATAVPTSIVSPAVAQPAAAPLDTLDVPPTLAPTLATVASGPAPSGESPSAATPAARPTVAAPPRVPAGPVKKAAPGEHATPLSNSDEAAPPLPPSTYASTEPKAPAQPVASAHVGTPVVSSAPTAPLRRDKAEPIAQKKLATDKETKENEDVEPSRRDASDAKAPAKVTVGETAPLQTAPLAPAQVELKHARLPEHTSSASHDTTTVNQASFSTVPAGHTQPAVATPLSVDAPWTAAPAIVPIGTGMPAVVDAPAPIAESAARLVDQAIQDPGLSVAVLPHAAHLSINSTTGDLALHVRVRDGNADVNVSGSMAPLFDSRAPEVRSVLAGEGLHLGSFATDQHGQSQHQQHHAETPSRSDAPPARPSPRSTLAPSRDSLPLADHRIHVTA